MAVHFFLTTFGSLGDLHPYIAVGLGLQQRGHRVTIGTSELYRAKVEGEGLAFHPIRPHFSFLQGDPEATARVMEKAFHPRKGTEYIVRSLMLPHLRDSYDDTLEMAREADVLVGHPIAFATSLVAEKLQKPWAAVILQPSPLLSVYDPPALSGAEFLYRPMQMLGPRGWAWLFRLAGRMVKRWGEPLGKLREDLGLNAQENPIMQGMFSPYASHAWFSKVLAPPQPDWPKNLVVTGFPLYDKLQPGNHLNPELEKFLSAGPPPVVFTLGSSAVFTSGQFYGESLKAALEVGCRAVLLTGADPRNKPSQPLPDTIHVAEYAPYSQLLPRAAASVHQGGVGTTGQALLSGRPMLIVPYSHDQPDNARRVVRLGAGRTIARHRYTAKRVATELALLLNCPAYASAARQVASEMRTEDGVRTACEKLEALVRQ